ncbi:MAG: SDR family NAD(P)-dependent oxidoreductase [Acidobacteriaceae bacterium]
MDLDLKQQVVFVAGSSRGIGRAIAATLLAEGARVVLTGRSESSLADAVRDLRRDKTAEDETAGRLLPITADLTDSAAIEEAYAQTLERFGRIDHLVANLGTGSGTPGALPSAEDWSRLFELNFFASVRLTEALLPRLRAQGAGSILYLSSIVGVEATPAPLPYSAAKAALINYAKNLSRLVAADGIRVNTIAPGNIFFSGGSWERHLTNRPEAVREMLEREVPQKRFGTVEEIASLAAYLCSSRAGFSTGGTFIMDGGQTRRI